MNLEEMYTTLRGASGGSGAKYEIVLKWFNTSKIIDGRFITSELFTRSYERLCPNGEELSLVQFVQLLGILSRQSKQDVEIFLARFRDVNEVIIGEIQESANRHLADVAENDPSFSESERRLGFRCMEDTFQKLKKDGRNSVDNLIRWMKDSKVVDGVKVTEANARKLFEDVKDKQNVELEKFKQALAALATEHKKKADEFTASLAREGTRFLSAATAAAVAAADAAATVFKEAIDKK